MFDMSLSSHISEQVSANSMTIIISPTTDSKGWLPNKNLNLLFNFYFSPSIIESAELKLCAKIVDSKHRYYVQVSMCNQFETLQLNEAIKQSQLPPSQSPCFKFRFKVLLLSFSSSKLLKYQKLTQHCLTACTAIF